MKRLLKQHLLFNNDRETTFMNLVSKMNAVMVVKVAEVEFTGYNYFDYLNLILLCLICCFCFVFTSSLGLCR